MKRCPQCRRDYFDDSLLYCLEDGTPLIQGSVPSPDEPATAILHDTSQSNEETTSAHLQITDRTVDLPSGITNFSRPGFDWRLVAATAVMAIIALAGFAAYRYVRPTSSNQISSVAVLPFQNRSDDADTEYLSDGLAESLIFRLTQVPGLKVSPTSSVMRYKSNEVVDVAKVASDLGVDAVMTGRLVKRGDNLNITVELVDTRNNKSLWGEQYERRMSDLLSTQREIAAAIVQKLQLKLNGNDQGVTKKYTDSNEAYQLYLNARFHFARRTKEDLYKSIDLFQRAVAIDPNFALAYSGLAESYAVIPSFPYASPAECFPKAKAAVARALELDPNLPEAHTVAGMIAATYDWDWTTAEREFKQALEIDPNLAITHYRYAWTYLSPLGRHDEAIAEMKKAMELEPLSLIQGANYAGVLMYARRYDEAIAQARKTVDLDPQFFGGKSWLCHSYVADGKYNEALAIAEPTLTSENPFLSDAGLAYALSGQRENALGIVDRWRDAAKREYIMNYLLAMTYGALGNKDEAFAELEKAYQNHDWFLQRLKVDPAADPLRNDPRFDAMIKRLNLPQ